MKPSLVLRSASAALLLALTAGAMAVFPLAAFHHRTKVLGLKNVFAFTYSPTQNFDLKTLHSATMVGPVNPADWQYWHSRGVVAAFGHTWFDLLRSPVDKAVANLTGQDYGGDPHPVNMIDEFGFDYGGQMDQKSAEILRQTRLKRPDLALAVWQMREPIPQVLAEAYRDDAALVMFESYVHSQRQYWWIATQAWSARKYGLLPKTIFVLGLGKGGNPGEDWAETKEELEQQMRFVRLIAPESPGIGFFGGTPELLAAADALCARFPGFPASGFGLPTEVREVAATFTQHYAKPTLVASPSLVGPNYTEDGKALAQPVTMRAYIVNLGDADAHDVRIRLRNQPRLGGNVFAEGQVQLIPKHSEVIALLPITDKWREWVGQWVVEVDAAGCDVRIFKP